MNLNLIGPVNQLSYGNVTVGVLNGLNQLGVEVSLFPINPQNMTVDPHYHNLIKNSLAADSNIQGKLYDSHADCVRIFHQNGLATFVGKGKHIGFPIFELDTFTEVEKHHVNSCDEIFVCSEWAKRVVLENCDNFTYNINEDEVHVIPLGVDTSIFYPAQSRQSTKMVFFNCGKWEIRKGHDVLVKMFNDAFEKTDDVELWMMPANPFYTLEEHAEWERLYKNSKLGDKIKILPHVETADEVADIMRKVDFGVFPARAEGWNLSVLELMACGVHSIVTNYSGHTEFCNRENSFLVPVDDREPAFDGKWFFNQGNWGKITDNVIDEFINHMRECYEYPMGGYEEEVINTAKRLSWKNTAEKIIQALNN